MKKILLSISIFLFLLVAPTKPSHAQALILQIIKTAINKVIVAIDLNIQRIQNQTIWLQNAQKTLENEMSQLRLSEIAGWVDKQQELYASYFQELSSIKTAISTYQAVKDIVNQQTALVTEYALDFNRTKQDPHFNAPEISYIGQVYEGILEESLKNISQVQLVITAFVTQMTDEKRLAIIHSAAGQIDQNLNDLRQFNQQNIQISLQRAKDQNDVNLVKKIYGIE